MRNEDIASVFDEIADLLDLGGENFFRVRAYRNAARIVRDYPEQVATLSRKKLDQIPGVGADLADKIATLAATGDLPLRTELRHKFPASLLDLRNVGALDPSELGCWPSGFTSATAMTSFEQPKPRRCALFVDLALNSKSA
jgi:DNA polymerase (family X)